MSRNNNIHQRVELFSLEQFDKQIDLGWFKIDMANCRSNFFFHNSIFPLKNGTKRKVKIRYVRISSKVKNTVENYEKIMTHCVLQNGRK